MPEHNRKVLMVGYGAVAQCTLPLLIKEAKIPGKHITVMDFEDRRDQLKPWMAQGVRFVQQRIERDNLGLLLSQHLRAGDLLVDLAWNIDCLALLKWCHDHGVLYINTSVEVWDPYHNAERQKPTEKTLYWRHMNIRRLLARWKTPGPTAVLEHGANPGLISHWTKRGLIDIAERLLEDGKVSGHKEELLRDHLRTRSFNHLAMQLGIKVIHCSERDTQLTARPKEVNEFVNTWSIEGFREEGITTAEMGWGTHEKQLPAHAFTHADGPQNQICLARMGINTRVRSWVPYYDIVGMVVRHGEAFSISDRLTVWEDDKPVYRPTVHYAYCPCASAILSLDELRARHYELQPKLRIMSDEITRGSDILGALLMGHEYNAWWTGSDLSIEESRRLVPHQNATTLQVAISVVAATLWMMENPERGVLVPDDLPHDYVLKIADPYLGNNLSIPSDWNPLQNYYNPFRKYNKPDLDLKDPWQFKNFLVQD